MPSNQTPNYALSQWERTDRVLMEDFNADNAKLDAALAGLAGQVAGKAAQSALDALSQTVAGHTAALRRKGNCRIDTQSYVGTGECGAEHPTSITFSARPMFFLVYGPSVFIFGQGSNNSTISFYNGGYSYRSASLPTTWTGSTVSFYYDNVLPQANGETTYFVVALYAEDAV